MRQKGRRIFKNLAPPPQKANLHEALDDTCHSPLLLLDPKPDRQQSADHHDAHRPRHRRPVAPLVRPGQYRSRCHPDARTGRRLAPHGHNGWTLLPQPLVWPSRHCQPSQGPKGCEFGALVVQCYRLSVQWCDRRRLTSSALQLNGYMYWRIGVYVLNGLSFSHSHFATSPHHTILRCTRPILIVI